MPIDPFEPPAGSINRGMRIIRTAIASIQTKCTRTLSYSITATSDDGDFALTLRGLDQCDCTCDLNTLKEN